MLRPALMIGLRVIHHFAAKELLNVIRCPTKPYPNLVSSCLLINDNFRRFSCFSIFSSKTKRDITNPVQGVVTLIRTVEPSTTGIKIFD